MMEKTDIELITMMHASVYYEAVFEKISFQETFRLYQTRR